MEDGGKLQILFQLLWRKKKESEVEWPTVPSQWFVRHSPEALTLEDPQEIPWERSLFMALFQSELSPRRKCLLRRWQ